MQNRKALILISGIVLGIARPACGVDFKREIQPIFAERCYSCHSQEKQKGGLRLDRKADALAGGDNGKVLQPGNSAGSLLFKLISGLDPDKIMPQKGERLTSDQIAAIQVWLDAGAAWPEDVADGQKKQITHWAFVAPQAPAPPSVKDSAWVRNPIDAFVLRRLEEQQIRPSPEADRITLIRRLSFDLLGLPPKPAEVDRFLKDVAPDAYERLVDRLLASPQYGERWGRHWLDLARYADSDGYEKDGVRPFAYLYRDWVIDALNQDLPFDQFTIQQLAGDLLPNATVEQKVATGFHRNTLTNKEGGVDPEEYRCKANVDRVSSTAAVWLGLTMACAECHSHKYDPITQREFYQFYSFFNNASEVDLSAPTATELAQYKAAKSAWEKERARLEEGLASYIATDRGAKLAQWEKTAWIASNVWTVLMPVKVASANGATLVIESNGVVVASGKAPATDQYTVEIEPALRALTGFRLEVMDDPAPGKGPGRARNNNFVLSEFTVKVGTNHLGAGEGAKAIPLQNALADHSSKDWPVAATLDGKTNTGWAIDPQFDRGHVAVFETKTDLELRPGERLFFTLDQQYGSQHTLGRFRLSAINGKRPIPLDTTPDAIAGIVRLPPPQRPAAQKTALEQYFYGKVDEQGVRFDSKIQSHTTREPKYPATKAQTLAENDKPRMTHIHVRGDFLRKGDEVEPGTPGVLHKFTPRSSRPDRLDLARWIVDPANPLTSRVTANRIWGHLFGRALSPSVEDFGTRGGLPSHPELLDWLAKEFPRLKWSQKALIKLIVTSATYRQSSNARPELVDRDPTNLLLARQNRFRLEAETVRDAALAASGLLNPALGGPSVRPPLPADIAAIGYANSVKWKESEGGDKYRRGLYIFFQRTVPYPMLMTFDAPDSTLSCTRRERSNTPLQALTLLNDPVFFECAQALPQHGAVSSARTVQEKIKEMHKLALSRVPTESELARLEKLYSDQLRLLQKNETAVTNLVKSSTPTPPSREAASLVGVGRILLNLDEFVNRE